MTIKLFTRDGNTVIEATATNDNETPYGAGEVTGVRILRTGPRNDPTEYPAVIAAFTTEPTFQGTIPGTLPIEGYWGFQFEYTLASSAEPVYTIIFYAYVGPTIIALSQTVESSNSLVLQDLIPNTDIIPSSSYSINIDAAGSGLETVAGSSPFRTYFSLKHDTAIRQSGTITGLTVGLGPDASDLNWLVLEIWRFNGVDWDRVGVRSENMGAEAAANANSIHTFTLATPMHGVRVGDRWSIFIKRLDGLGLPNAIQDRETGGIGCAFQNSGGFLATPFAWGGQPTKTSYPYVEILMQAPKAIVIGDSHAEGNPLNDALIGGGVTVAPEVSWPGKLQDLTGWSLQNNSIGGITTSVAAEARFDADVVAYKPRIAILAFGTNDINGGILFDDFVTAYTSVLNKCVANGITAICVGILPRTDFDNAKNIEKEARNTKISELAKQFGFLYVDLTPVTGEYDPLEPSFNLRNIKTGLGSGDNIHYNEAANTIIANEIFDHIKFYDTALKLK